MDNTLTWKIEGVKPGGASGFVTFKAKVNEDAVQQGIGNKAAVQIGRTTKVETNTTDDGFKPAVGALTIHKNVVIHGGQSGVVDANKSFEFRVTLKDAAGQKLNGAYDFKGLGGAESGELFSWRGRLLKHGQSIMISGLPVGATYEVVETAAAGYTTTSEGAAGTITDQGAIATFTNAYTAALPVGKPVNTDGRFSKKLVGRDWKAGDTFIFNIEAQDGAPAPKTSKVELTAPDAKNGDEVKFGFGAIDFGFGDIAGVQPDEHGRRSKDFVYKVTEVKGDIPGVTYDGHAATLTVTITDEGNGVLSAAYKLEGAVFTNTYKTSEVVVDAAIAKGAIQVVKTLTGRPIAAGDFQFTMDPVNDDAKAKFGKPRTIDTTAGDLGAGDANTAIATTRFATGLKFGLDDADKTFTFRINENKGGGVGYANDSTVHDLAISVYDNGDGTLRVEAKLGEAEPVVWTSADTERAPLSVPFRNAYEAGSITVGGDGIVGLRGTEGAHGPSAGRG